MLGRPRSARLHSTEFPAVERCLLPAIHELLQDGLAENALSLGALSRLSVEDNLPCLSLHTRCFNFLMHIAGARALRNAMAFRRAPPFSRSARSCGCGPFSSSPRLHLRAQQSNKTFNDFHKRGAFHVLPLELLTKGPKEVAAQVLEQQTGSSF